MFTHPLAQLCRDQDEERVSRLCFNDGDIIASRVLGDALCHEISRSPTQRNASVRVPHESATLLYRCRRLLFSPSWLRADEPRSIQDLSLLDRLLAEIMSIATIRDNLVLKLQLAMFQNSVRRHLQNSMSQRFQTIQARLLRVLL